MSNGIGLKTWLELNNLEHNLVSRMKYILLHTMGAPNAFEFRREELYEMKRDSNIWKSKEMLDTKIDTKIETNVETNVETMSKEISDDEVVESFVNSVKPYNDETKEEGFVMRFLRLATIGVRIHDTVFIIIIYTNTLITNSESAQTSCFFLNSLFLLPFFLIFFFYVF